VIHAATGELLRDVVLTPPGSGSPLAASTDYARNADIASECGNRRHRIGDLLTALITPKWFNAAHLSARRSGNC